MTGIRVLIAGTDERMKRTIVEMVRILGCINVGTANDPQRALKLIRAVQPDFVILEGRLAFIELAKTVEEQWLSPLLLITDLDSWNFLAPVIDRWEFDYLEKPVNVDALKLKMCVGIDKYRNNMESAGITEQLHSALTTRNMVDRAAAMLAAKKGLTRIQALVKIQIMSGQQGITLRDMAGKIISLKGLTA